MAESPRGPAPLGSGSPMVRARAVVVLLAVSGLLTSHAGAQQGTVPPVLRPALRNGPAETGCVDGAPVTVYREPLPSAMRAELEVHEAVHRAQLAGDCDRILQAIVADRHRYAEAEAAAGCAQLEATVEPSVMARTVALGTLSGWLQARFPDLPADTLNALIARRCGLWRPA
jgi:hypothetical protein